jgi:EmrB/QacA subfamily drug resistance transporter
MTAESALPPQKKQRLILGVFGLMLGVLLSMLDNLIVGTALPTIAGDLGGLDHLSWVVTAYTLATAAATPIWGKMGDLYGRKNVFLAAIALFLACSVLTGLSQTMGQLIAFRAGQGIGAGGLMVGAIAIVGEWASPRQRSQFQAMLGGMLPIALVGGPLLGGFLTDQASWRWAFYINIPVGAVAIASAGWGVQLRSTRINARVDYPGAALLTAGVVALSLLASWAGTRYPWVSAPIAMLAAVSVLTITGFVLLEHRVTEPILPPRLFRNRNFAVAQILGLLGGAAMLGAVSFLPQYMQFVLGVAPTVSGLLTLPLMMGMFGAQLMVGRVIRRRDRYRRYPIAGAAMLIAGMLVLLLLGVGTPAPVASALTVVAGLGLGLLMQPTVIITMRSAEPRDLGAASGAMWLFRTIGGSLGVAVLGSVFTERLSTSLTTRLGPAAGHALASGGGRLTPALLQTLPAPAREAFQAAVTSGIHGVVGYCALAGALATAVALFLRETPLRTPVESANHEPESVTA